MKMWSQTVPEKGEVLGRETGEGDEQIGGYNHWVLTVDQFRIPLTQVFE